MSAHATIGNEELRRLKWRSRRGLLECDLFVSRFFELHGRAGLTTMQAEGLRILMDLDDPTLLELLLRRREPEGDLYRDDVRAVLVAMQVRPSQASLSDDA